MANKIDTIILDVDGVINGTLEGINTPFPSVNVVERLLKFQNSGGTIMFCTSKGIYPIVEIVKSFNFSGFHIADAGGIIYLAEQNKYIIDGFTVDQNIFNILFSTDEYFEIYSDNDWFILRKFKHVSYVSKHTKLLRRKPKLYDSIQEIIGINASKILFFSEDSVVSDKNTQLSANLKKYNTKWTMSPVLLPANLMVITKKGVSKEDAILKLAKEYKFSLTNALGVGDHHSDWKFMSLCTYKGIMENSTNELKSLTEKDKNSYVGGCVDKDGLIDIMNHFGI